MERRVVADTHDWQIGHVTIEEDDEYLFLYVGARDLRFRKSDGSLVEAGTFMVDKPHNRYCMECQNPKEETP